MLIAMLWLAAQTNAEWARGVRNYEAVARGQIAFGSLSSAQQEEVRAADRAFRARQAGRPTFRERCIAQQRLAGDTPTHLEQATIDLKCGRD